MIDLWSDRKKLLRTGLIGIAIFCIFTIYFLGVTLALSYNTDHVIIMQEAKEIAAGNVFLKGWTLSTVSYFTTEIPFFVLGIMLLGYSLQTYFIVTAVGMAALSLLIMMLAAIDVEGIFSIQKAIICMGFLAFFPLLVSNWVLLAPNHIGVYVLIMVCILLLRIIDRTHALAAYIVYSIFLILIVIGDSVGIYMFIIPVCLALGIRLSVGNAQRKPNFVLLILTIVSAVLGKCGLWLIQALGGFVVPGLATMRFISISSFGNSITLFLYGILDLFGIELSGNPIYSVDTVLAAIRLCSLLILFYALYQSARKMKDQNLENQLFIIAISLNLLEYLFSNVAVSRFTVRYLAPSLLYGIILITGFIAQSQFFKKRRYLVYGYCVLLMITSIPSISVSIRPFSYSKVSAFLIDHNLRYGYSDYWNTSIFNVYTQDELLIRPITSIDGKILHPFNRLSERSWYDHKASFVLLDGKDNFSVDEETVKNTFGEPDQIYTVDGFTVFTWDRDISQDLPKIFD